jgi:uncharacterized membrane protein HdeD (DUF308 family)
MPPPATLSLFAANWRLLMFRGAIALASGAVAVLWRELQLDTWIVVFGAYALADALATTTMAVRARGVRGFGSLLAQGLVGITAGVVALMWPAMVATTLPAFVAAWAATKGVAEILAAIALRPEVSDEWPLAATGALSITCGALIMPGLGLDHVALAWVFGFYAIFLGIFLLSIARRLRQLAQEMTRPRSSAPHST